MPAKKSGLSKSKRCSVSKASKPVHYKIEHPYEEQFPPQMLILGMDEAGRGPLCGPVCAAGVILPPGFNHPDLYDSKKVSEKKREKLFEVIIEQALYYQIVMIDEKTIDEKNIYRAVQDGMESIARKAPSEMVLTDAMPLASDIIHEAIVKGDMKSVNIAAASILAKVSRDHYMARLDQEYPQFGLARHKGYPTKAHLEALAQSDVVPDFYRRSYKPVQQRIDDLEALKKIEKQT